MEEFQMDKNLNNNISILRLGKNITNTLLNNNIKTILNLCNYSRMELSDLELSNEQINEIIIALQLLGLDLKRNHAKRNTLLDNILNG